jgi:putative methyltransferase (TIGR04325 family)
VLDWGGGFGYHYLVARALLPDASFEWVIRDVPLVCDAGRRLMPDIRFTSSDDEALSTPSSLVLASSSIQYSRNWREIVAGLAAATAELLLITRLMVCHGGNDFVVLQRNYNSDYPGWVLNRTAFLQFMQANCRMALMREFLICPGEDVHGAPERHEQRAFLFAPRH